MNDALCRKAYTEAVDEARARISAVLALGSEFPELTEAVKILALETTQSVSECRRLLSLVSASLQDRASHGWSAAYQRAAKLGSLC
jgi:hypothetical protein